jgi:hypothetical protein
MMRRAWLAAALVLWPLGAASADPAAILDYLGKTPATRLDLALARVGALVDSAGAAAGYGGFASVEDTQIMIRAYSDAAKPDAASCKAIIDGIRRAGGVDPNTGQPDEPASAYASLFSYPGVDESKLDESYAETVDSMISIMVVIGQTGNGEGMVCQGKLLSADAAYEKQ